MIPHIGNKTILRQPQIKVAYPHLPLEELVHQAMQEIAAGQGMKAMSVAQLRRLVGSWMARAAINERMSCVKELRNNGLEMAAQAIDR